MSKGWEDNQNKKRAEEDPERRFEGFDGGIIEGNQEGRGKIEDRRGTGREGA